MSGPAATLALWLAAAGAPTAPPTAAAPGVAPAPAAAPAAAPAPVAAPPPAAPPPPVPAAAPPVPAPAPRHLPPPPAHLSPFRLSLTYTRVLHEDGTLGANDMNTNAIGIDMGMASGGYTRSHLAIANQWESLGPYSARGFRIDLISVGYPILLVAGRVKLELEPILTFLRGEIMFVSGTSEKVYRIESGVGLELSVAFNGWFLAVQPLAIDFRYYTYLSAPLSESHTGFSRIVPFRIGIGHEF